MLSHLIRCTTNASSRSARSTKRIILTGHRCHNSILQRSSFESAGRSTRSFQHSNHQTSPSNTVSSHSRHCVAPALHLMTRACGDLLFSPRSLPFDATPAVPLMRSEPQPVARFMCDLFTAELIACSSTSREMCVLYARARTRITVGSHGIAS